MMRQWWRIGGAAGVAFVVLFIVAGFGLQGDSPGSGDSAEEIRAYFTDDRDMYLVSDYLIGIAFVFLFLPFVSALSGFLGRAEGDPRMWSRLVFGAGVLLVAFGGAASVFWGGLAYRAAEYANDDTLLMLNDINNYAFAGFGLGVGLLLLTTSIIIIETGVIGRWLGWAGLIIGMVATVSGLGTLDQDQEGVLSILGFIAFIGWGLWTIAVSVQLLRAPAPPPERSELL